MSIAAWASFALNSLVLHDDDVDVRPASSAPRPPRRRARCVVSLASLAVAGAAAEKAHSAPRVIEFKLDNGLQVLVIPDHRAPVVTQMIWYQVGAADEPPGSSGIAHFLEHLMFKGTDKIPTGQFSKIVAQERRRG